MDQWKRLTDKQWTNKKYEQTHNGPMKKTNRQTMDQWKIRTDKQWTNEKYEHTNIGQYQLEYIYAKYHIRLGLYIFNIVSIKLAKLSFIE